MIINFRKLAKNSLRRKALQIAEAGYEAIDIEKAIPRRVQIAGSNLRIEHIYPYDNKTVYEEENIDLSSFERVFLAGIGKGSSLACLVLARMIGKFLTHAISLDVHKPKLSLRDRFFLGLGSRLENFIGTHPLPSEENIKATGKIMELAQNLTEKDLLIFFICGGGSSLASTSKSEVNSISQVTRAFFRSGGDIIELNTVRKHLSDFKGGGFAKMAGKARIISLIVSDVLGNDLSMISSGPTALDITTKADAEKILQKYGLNPLDFPLIETPKDPEIFRNTKNILLFCNQDPIMAMYKKSEDLGLKPRILGLAINVEAQDLLPPLIHEVKSNEAILIAGETTVNLGQGSVGKGGRNQEAVLGALAKSEINNQPVIGKDLIFMSLASDGRDNTDAAGAIGDLRTLEKAQKLNLDMQEYLGNHNAYEFFQKTGDLIFTEPKSFNVADLMVVLRQ